MSHRPLVFVSGLTVGDYLLWNWSLNSNHDVLALVSGLTLPPLAVAALWLLALSLARLIARSRSRPSRSSSHAIAPVTARRARGTSSSTAAPLEEASAATAAGADPPARSPPDARSLRRVSRRPRAPAPPLQARPRSPWRGARRAARRRPASAATSTSATAPAASTTPTRASSPSPRRSCPTHGPDRFSWPIYGYTKNHTRFFPAPATRASALPPAVGAQRRLAARVPARDLRRSHLPARRRRRAQRDQQAHRPHLLDRASSARSRPPPPPSTPTPSMPPCSPAATAKRPAASWRSTTPTARRAGRATCPAPASPPRCSTATGSSSAPRAGSSTRSTLATATSCGPTTPPAPSRPAPRSSDGVALLRRLLRPRAGHLRADRPAPVDQRLRRRAARQRHLLLDRAPSSTGACSSATPTGASTPMTPSRQARLGRADRRLRLRLAGRHQRARLGPTIYLGSYDGTFYALDARSGHISWRFNAGGRISGSATIVGRTVYFADLGEHRTYGLGISTGRVAVREVHRRLRPGHQRRRTTSTSRATPASTGSRRASASGVPASTRASRLRVIATTRGSGARGASGEACGTGESAYSQPSVPVANTSAPERAV